MKQRQRKCKGCGERFQPTSIGQVACKYDCALVVARSRLERKEKRERRERKAKLKTRQQWIQEAQSAVNAWIRWRDRLEPCICCGRQPNNDDLMTGSRWDAGHYRSRGACPELRFEPLNIHKCCVRCNRNLSGNIVEMRINLVRKIGPDAMEWLEGPHDPKKWTIDQLKAIRDDYRARLKEGKAV